MNHREAGWMQAEAHHQSGATEIPFVHLVDADPQFLSAMARQLMAHGFAVQTFLSASEFLAQRDCAAAGCVMADLPRPASAGFELQAALARSGNPLPLLFLTANGDIPSAVRAMRAGAEDVLEKGAAPELMLEALRRALARDARERAERARHHAMRARFDAVSAREFEVLSHVVQGRLNKQIAGDLGIRERTVKLHRSAIMNKLGVRSVAALTRLTQEAALFTA